MNRDTKEWIAVALTGIAVFVVLGAVTASSRGIAWNYLVGVLIVMSVYALFALGLSVQFGHGGLLNLGHVAFMGVGAYTVGILGMRWGDALAPRLVGTSPLGLLTGLVAAALAAGVALVPALLASQRVLRARTARTQALAAGGVAAGAGIAAFAAVFPLTPVTAPNGVVLLGIVAGVVLAAAASLLLALPAIRLREDYLAIVTLGFAEIFRHFAVNEEWLTRGTLGIITLQRPVATWALETPWWGALADALRVRPVALAHATLGVLLVAFVLLLLQTLARSPWGRVLKAIREDEAVAASLGKNVTLYKLQALMIGAAIAALAGILFVWNLTNVFPEHFLNLTTFFAFIILVLGGIGNHKGAILGTFVLWGLFELAGSLTSLSFIRAGPTQQIFVGVVLVVVMMLRPQGAIGRKEELVLAK